MAGCAPGRRTVIGQEETATEALVRTLPRLVRESPRLGDALAQMEGRMIDGTTVAMITSLVRSFEAVDEAERVLTTRRITQP